jgi:hypothetical protein
MNIALARTLCNIHIVTLKSAKTLVSILKISMHVGILFCTSTHIFNTNKKASVRRQDFAEAKFFSRNSVLPLFQLFAVTSAKPKMITWSSKATRRQI